MTDEEKKLFELAEQTRDKAIQTLEERLETATEEEEIEFLDGLLRDATFQRLLNYKRMH